MPVVRGEGVRVAGRSNINVTYGEYPLSRLEFRRSDPLCSSLRTASASLQTKPSFELAGIQRSRTEGSS